MLLAALFIQEGLSELQILNANMVYNRGHFSTLPFLYLKQTMLELKRARVIEKIYWSSHQKVWFRDIKETRVYFKFMVLYFSNMYTYSYLFWRFGNCSNI